jgi:hypothetical protein
MAKERTIDKPENWMTIEEIQAYVKKMHGRHWSTSYIYSLIKSERLPAFKLGKIFLKEDVDSLVKSFKKAPPPLLQKVE